MIEVIFYRNGFEIKGHSHQVVCSEVSILAWAYSNSINKVDYSDKNCWQDSKEKGYTAKTFDVANEKAEWLFIELIHNMKIWGPELWKEEVKFIEMDLDLEIEDDPERRL